MNYNSATIILFIAIAFAIYSQTKIDSIFRKNSKIKSKTGYTGREVARIILDENGLYDIPVRLINGNLTDNYNTGNKTLNLSQNVFDSDSIAAISVAAHEAGHAVQDSKNYAPLRIRNFLVPAVNFASKTIFIIIILGFIFSNSMLFELGIAVFTVIVLFQLITLPVEIDASKKAMVIIKEKGLLKTEEINKGKSVLRAAALTYIASAFVSLAQLARLYSFRDRS